MSGDYANKLSTTLSGLDQFMMSAGKENSVSASAQAAVAPVRRPRRKPLTRDEIQRLSADYAAGVSVEDLASEYRCHRATVLKYTAQAGVHRPKTFKVAPDQVTEMLRLYERGVGTGEIGRRLGFTTKTVRRRLKSAGIYGEDSRTGSETSMGRGWSGPSSSSRELSTDV